MLAGMRVRLYPTEEQEIKFRKFCGAARFVYNECLFYRIRVYEEELRSCSVQELIEHIQDLKYSKEYSWLLEVPEAVTKQAIKDLDKAYENFFRRGNKGFPKPKKKGRCKDSFYQRTDRLKQVDDTHVKITGIKEPVRMSKCFIPERVMNPRVVFDGKYWYLSFTYEVEELPKIEDGEIVGVDVGLKNLAVTSDNVVYKNINHSYRVMQLEKRLKRLQRRLSRKYELNKQGNKFVKTNNIKKLENQIRLIHRRLRNIRNTYIHTVTMDLVRTKPRMIVIEDLNIRGMLKNKHISAWVQKQCFHKFRSYLAYKCKFFGTELVVADRFYASSKICSCCGYKKRFLSLSERVYRCENCGHMQDRDLNAAINLRNYGLAL